jgi:NADH-quinone oxidoreductase subunit H
MSFDVLEFLESLLQLKVADYLREVFAIPEWIFDVVQIFILATFLLVILLLLIWLERKLVARIQDRIGPNRVGGRYGLLQAVADAIKMLTKEFITPAGADRIAYNLAPLIIVVSALLMWAVIPFAPGVIGTDLNVGVFYILAISSVSVVALLLAGWGSNNKYALLGAFRSVAQLVSYEVPMVMALLIPVMLTGSMSMQEIVQSQQVWYIVAVPISALIFLISALAELGRTPFDLLEAESEIVAGYHIEYSGMKFGMFMMAEFLNTFFMSALFTTIYLGGWRGPSAVEYPLLGMLYFFIKTFAVLFVIIWIRGTFPRVRIDQLLNFNWKFLVPLTLVLILIVGLVLKILPADTNHWIIAGMLLLANLVLGFIALELVRRSARRQRVAAETKAEQQGQEALDATETQPVASAAH